MSGNKNLLALYASDASMLRQSFLMHETFAAAITTTHPFLISGGGPNESWLGLHQKPPMHPQVAKVSLDPFCESICDGAFNPTNTCPVVTFIPGRGKQYQTVMC